MHMQVIGYIKS